MTNSKIEKFYTYDAATGGWRELTQEELTPQRIKQERHKNKWYEMFREALFYESIDKEETKE